MSNFKPGDLVTIGDNPEVYTLSDDNNPGCVCLLLANGAAYSFFRNTGKHVYDELPSLKRYDASEPLSSTDPAFAKAQLSGGLRHDSGKLRLDLLPPEWELELARITTEGSKKYAPRNWEKGMPWSKMVGCARRHFLKYLLGEKYDKETGCHHLGLAAWNLLALMVYDMRKLGENDLPQSVKVGPNFERVDVD